MRVNGTSGFLGDYYVPIYVQPACSASLAPAGLPLAVIQSAYPTTTLSVPGTAGAALWSASGTLPPGMTFTNGVLSGTPTAAGDFPLRITPSPPAGARP